MRATGLSAKVQTGILSGRLWAWYRVSGRSSRNNVARVRYLISIMKPIKTKRQLRDELNQQVSEFLDHGGSVKEVPRGLSGREDARGPLVSIFDGQGGEDRTPGPEVVAAIEARRKPHPPLHKSNRKPRPRKRVILDDFGQPLRWEWVEE